VKVKWKFFVKFIFLNWKVSFERMFFLTRW